MQCAALLASRSTAHKEGCRGPAAPLIACMMFVAHLTTEGLHRLHWLSLRAPNRTEIGVRACALFASKAFQPASYLPPTSCLNGLRAERGRERARGATRGAGPTARQLTF